jgi:hypothetical protein
MTRNFKQFWDSKIINQNIIKIILKLAKNNI